MDTVNVKKVDFVRILDTAETLIDEIESALSQDEIAKSRLSGIVSGKMKGKTEKDYYAYLKKRGVKAN